jgi:hypothetical protein
MSKLTDVINTFETGDLVFTRFPPKGTQPIHVTLFLSARDAVKPSYVHAGATHVEIADASTYAVDKDSGGYLHARLTAADMRSRVTRIARAFAGTAKLTPYGSYPSSKDFTRLNIEVKSPNASRFGVMVKTPNFDAIPFDFPALHRLLKWTWRAECNATFSENRGITCAAFASACQQVARMQAFLKDNYMGGGLADTLADAVKTLNGMVQTKASLRENLEQLGKDEQTGKTIYKGQAERANSNRKFTPDGMSKFKEMARDVKTRDFPEEIIGRIPSTAKDAKAPDKPLTPIENQWLVIQTKLLKVPQYSAKLLEDILGSEWMFDAKYVNSMLLADRLQNSQSWATVEYKQY